MNKIKFNFSKISAKNIYPVFLKYKYLLFFIFFSAFLGFVFSIVYKYAYVDIEFMEYEESYESRVILNIRKSNQVFEEILANMEERNKKFEMRRSVEYDNPFEFKEADVLKSDEVNDSDADMNENGLITSSPVGAENDSMSSSPVEVENNPIMSPTAEIENDTINKDN